MTVSIHQPDYIPWLGFFYKVAHSDTFVYLDDAQYSNEAGHNYNVIKTPRGENRLKIPVAYSFGDPINRVRTRDALDWKKKHLKTLEMNYARADFFSEIFPSYSEILGRDYENIAALNAAVNGFLLDGFGIRTPVVMSSDLSVETRREQRVIDICLKLNANVYLSGTGARAYQNETHFAEQGINLIYSEYRPVEYRQCWEGFLPGLSALDFIFNCGFDWEFVEKTLRREDTWK